MWSRAERELLETLDVILQKKSVLAALYPIVSRVAAQILGGALVAKEPVPLAFYGKTLPAAIRSSWVYFMRAPATTDVERHPNSHQRTISFEGEGRFELCADN